MTASPPAADIRCAPHQRRHREAGLTAEAIQDRVRVVGQMVCFRPRLARRRNDGKRTIGAN